MITPEEKKRTDTHYQREQSLKNRMGQYEAMFRAAISEGKDARTKSIFEIWIQAYSELTNKTDGIDQLEKRLQEKAIPSPGVARVIAGDAKPLQTKESGEAIKPSEELSNLIRDFLTDAYHSKTRIGEKAEKIKKKAEEEGIPKQMLADMMRSKLRELGLNRDQVDYRIRVLGLNRNNTKSQLRVSEENPIEDSEDHRSEAQITSEVNRSLYVNRPEDPEVEQAIEERPVKDRMYIERLEKESKYRLEELNKKQEQIQVLNTKVEGYEDALTKFQTASDPKLQTSQPGKIWMYPFDWILEIQYAAAYKQGLQIDHDGSKVTNVTRVTGLERR